MSTPVDFPIDVKVSDRASMDDQLDRAVALARSCAMQEKRRGVLVTRHDFNRFSVELSDGVPYGFTRELWNS
jgi:hypothetical protein